MVETMVVLATTSASLGFKTGLMTDCHPFVPCVRGSDINLRATISFAEARLLAGALSAVFKIRPIMQADGAADLCPKTHATSYES
jgi:hypothetical protein